MNRALFTILVLGLPTAAAPVPKELKKDPLVGTWKVVSVNSNGSVGQAATDHWTIEDGGDLNSHNGARAPANPSPAVRLIFDPARRSVEYYRTQDRSGSPGIYKMEGETLTIAFNHASDIRPVSFTSGKGINLWTFTRIQPEGKR